MKKIDISLIKKYVNREELGKFTSEQLENDKDFMMGVISYTNDIKMYSFCSEIVKKDYEFVKYLVLKFKDNPEFIITVADNYLEHTDTDWESKELSIIMEKVLPREQAEKYEESNKTSYFTKRVEVEIEEAKDSKLESMIGMGFLLMFDQYNGSDIILNYYANCMIEEIIKDNNINFEKMLHTQFKSADRIAEIGVNNYIISFISNYDSMLGSYVSTHLDLIKPMANRIKQVQVNWDKYSSADEAKRYNNMLDMVHEYMNISNSNMSETEILYYVAKELGIVEKIKQYDGTNDMDEAYEMDLDYDKEVLDDMLKFEIERSIKERLTYIRIKKIMMNQLFSDIPLDLYSLINEDGRQTSETSKKKIIKLNPNN